MNNKQLINSLFQQARQKSLVQYIFALLRVRGIESYEKDPLMILKDQVLSKTIGKDVIDSSEAFWSLFANLSRVGTGHDYSSFIFPIVKGSRNYRLEAGKLMERDLAVHLGEVLGDNLSASGLIHFLRQFFAKYDSELMSFTKEQRLFKLPRFEVLQLLVNDRVGLFGFKVYFSNCSSAEYKREDKGTLSINLTLDSSGVGVFVGNLDELRQEYRIEDKRLYEVGLPGRYNRPGEWKPIVYPGDSSHLEKEALNSTKDERIQGVLFYMFCTGHRVIEFVAKMGVRLPKALTILPGDVNLQIVVPENGSNDFRNEFVYDGWLELPDGSVERIKEGLSTIQRSMQGLSFSFDNEVRWNLKYTIISHTRGAAYPNSRDIDYLRKIILSTQEEKDLVIDTALNWYQLGLLTQNPLNAFLCYHIAIEGLAIKLTAGQLSASKFFGFIKEDKNVKAKRTRECFDKYYDTYHERDLEKMIKEAYFDCVGSIKVHFKKALEKVFGRNHQIVQDYFEGKECIWSIRSELAHGEYSDWHYERYLKVWHELGYLQEIAKSFITRTILRLEPAQKIPGWSRSHRTYLSTDSPRGTLVVSRIDILPRKDWRIQPEWVE